MELKLLPSPTIYYRDCLHINAIQIIMSVMILHCALDMHLIFSSSPLNFSSTASHFSSCASHIPSQTFHTWLQIPFELFLFLLHTDD